MRLSEKISIESGLNPQIFGNISHNCKHWNIKQNLCTIVFDEIGLTPHLTLMKKQKIFLGLLMLVEKGNKYCDHALVFMLRGICSPWR